MAQALDRSMRAAGTHLMSAQLVSLNATMSTLAMAENEANIQSDPTSAILQPSFIPGLPSKPPEGSRNGYVWNVALAALDNEGRTVTRTTENIDIFCALNELKIDPSRRELLRTLKGQPGWNPALAAKFANVSLRERYIVLGVIMEDVHTAQLNAYKETEKWRNPNVSVIFSGVQTIQMTTQSGLHSAATAIVKVPNLERRTMMSAITPGTDAGVVVPFLETLTKEDYYNTIETRMLTPLATIELFKQMAAFKTAAAASTSQEDVIRYYKEHVAQTRRAWIQTATRRFVMTSLCYMWIENTCFLLRDKVTRLAITTENDTSVLGSIVCTLRSHVVPPAGRGAALGPDQLVDLLQLATMMVMEQYSIPWLMDAAHRADLQQIGRVTLGRPTLDAEADMPRVHMQIDRKAVPTVGPAY